MIDPVRAAQESCRTGIGPDRHTGRDDGLRFGQFIVNPFLK